MNFDDRTNFGQAYSFGRWEGMMDYGLSTNSLSLPTLKGGVCFPFP